MERQHAAESGAEAAALQTLARPPWSYASSEAFGGLKMHTILKV